MHTMRNVLKDNPNDEEQAVFDKTAIKILDVYYPLCKVEETFEVVLFLIIRILSQEIRSICLVVWILSVSIYL